MKSLLFCLLFTLASSLSVQANSSEEVKSYLKQTIIRDFSANGISATEALEQARKMGQLSEHQIYLNMVPREKLRQTMVYLTTRKASVHDIIWNICAQAGVQVAIRRDEILIFDVGSRPNN